jgi:hypothetical protein
MEPSLNGNPLTSIGEWQAGTCAMPLNPHNLAFNSSRDLIAALVAALEKAMRGKLEPTYGRQLINAARVFIADLDRKVAMLSQYRRTRRQR